MAKKLTVVEEHHFFMRGKNCVETRVVAVSNERGTACDMLADAFEDRWSEHVFPEEFWLSECHSPEVSPDIAWFSSKFPDEGVYKFCIKEL